MTIKTAKSKLDYLEGLRGVAALAVMIGHSFGAFWPDRKPKELDPSNLIGLIHVLYDGGFAVLIFFALSGFVLTYRAQQENGISILTSTAIKRYPRLMIPAIGSILLAYILLKFDLMFNQEAVKINNSYWLIYFYNFEADFLEAVKQGLYGAVFLGEVSYNSSLWTLRIEFYGALLIIALAIILRKSKSWKYLLLASLTLLGVWFFGNYGVYYGTLIAGLMIGMMDHKRRISAWIAFPSMLFALWLGGFNQGSLYWPINQAAIELNGNTIDNVVIAKSTGAVIMLMCLLRSQGLKAFFSTTICKFLGKISFSLYLVHVPIICSVGCWAFIYLTNHNANEFAAVTAIIVSLLASILSAIIFEIFIDRKSITTSSKISRIFNPSPKPIHQQ